jgi:hypothetical protein
MQYKKLVRSKTLLCANPYELPVNGKYESVKAGMIWHGKFADDQEEDGGDSFDRLCWLCRDIKAHENDCVEEDYSEEDQSAEDEAIAYDRFNEVSEIVM